MIRLALLLFTWLMATAALGQALSKSDRKYQPLTLDDAVQHLQKIHSDSLKQRIVSQTEEEFIGRAHLGLGMWMRNTWRLWRGGPLAKHFNALGVYHPDDMSGIILTCYYRTLRHQDWQLEAQIKRSQAYWQAAQVHGQRWRNDPVYRATWQARQDSALQAWNRAQLETKKIALPPHTFLRLYINYQCGLLSFGERTLLEGEVVRWVGNDLEMKIARYVDPRKKRRVIRCNAVTNDTVRLQWGKNHYGWAQP